MSRPNFHQGAAGKATGWGSVISGLYDLLLFAHHFTHPYMMFHKRIDTWPQKVNFDTPSSGQNTKKAFIGNIHNKLP